MTPEALANETVVARPQEPGGPWFVELREGVDPPVLLGPYANPAVARQDAAKVRQFVAAVVARARSGEVVPAA